MTFFQLVGLPAAPFTPLFSLSDAQLSRDSTRDALFAASNPGYPCRVSLTDAQIGEELLLASLQHQPAASPYRASGPIFVRRSRPTGSRSRRVCCPPMSPADSCRCGRMMRADRMTDAAACPGADAGAVDRAAVRGHRCRLHPPAQRESGCFSCAVQRTASRISVQPMEIVMSLTPGRPQSTARPSTAGQAPRISRAPPDRLLRRFRIHGMSAAPRYLQSLGFKALASTSSGSRLVARRAPDNGPTRGEILEHLRRWRQPPTCRSMPTSRTASAPTRRASAESVRLAVETGIAGLSIEDSVGPRLQRADARGADAATRRCSISTRPSSACAQRARRSMRSGADVMLIGRAECFLVGQPNIDETLARLVAYAHAGADCLYAPGIQNRRTHQRGCRGGASEARECAGDGARDTNLGNWPSSACAG